jgi:hypothetical protein
LSGGPFAPPKKISALQKEAHAQIKEQENRIDDMDYKRICEGREKRDILARLLY